MNPIQIIFQGKDLTKQAADSVKRNLGGIQESVKKTGTAFDTAMGVLAAQQIQQFGNAVSGFLKSSIDEASQAQAGIVQLEQVIKSTGGAAGLTADEVSDMATSFSRMTQFEDDAIIAGQTVLLQFTKLGEDVFPQATEAMLNLSARMGIDLPAAAKIVGKALEGEFSGLARFGVVLDDATKKQIDNLLKIGDTAGAQALILAELEKRFGGAAEAAGKTFAGSMERLNNAWGDFEETVGNALVENENFQKLLDKLIRLVNGLADAFVAMPEPVQTALVGIVGLVAVLAKLAPALITAKILFEGAGPVVAKFAAGASTLSATISGFLVKALVAVAAALGTSVGLVLALVVAVGALIAVLIKFGPEASKNFVLLADLWVKILVASFNRIIYEFQKWLNNWIARIRAIPGQVRELFTSIGTSIVQGIQQGISTAWAGFLADLQARFNALPEWAKKLIGAASPAKKFMPVGEAIAQGIGVGFNRGMRGVQPQMAFALQPASGGGRARGGNTTMSGNTFQFYSPLTHAERHRIRKEQEEAAQRELLRHLR